MDDLTYESFNNIDDYFSAHPEEENGFYDDMATIAMVEDRIIDYPEDWAS